MFYVHDSAVVNKLLQVSNAQSARAPGKTAKAVVIGETLATFK